MTILNCTIPPFHHKKEFLLNVPVPRAPCYHHPTIAHRLEARQHLVQVACWAWRPRWLNEVRCPIEVNLAHIKPLHCVQFNGHLWSSNINGLQWAMANQAPMASLHVASFGQPCDTKLWGTKSLPSVNSCREQTHFSEWCLSLTPTLWILQQTLNMSTWSYLQPCSQAASVWLTPVYTCLIPHDANSWSDQWQQTGTLEFTHWAGLCLMFRRRLAVDQGWLWQLPFWLDKLTWHNVSSCVAIWTWPMDKVLEWIHM